MGDSNQLTGKARELLDLVRDGRGEWVTRPMLAAAVGKARLNPWDIGLLEKLAVGGHLEIGQREIDTPDGYEWVYRFVEGKIYWLYFDVPWTPKKNREVSLGDFNYVQLLRWRQTEEAKRVKRVYSSVYSHPHDPLMDVLLGTVRPLEKYQELRIVGEIIVQWKQQQAEPA